MGDLSEHFSATEFACGCGCGFGTRPGDVSADLLVMLEAVRKARGTALRPTSGCRCEVYNRRVGGVENSEHMIGEAADIWAPGSAAKLSIVEAAVACGVHRIGVGRTYVHLGVSAHHPPGLWGYNEPC